MTICGALALNQFVNPIAIDSLGWKYVRSSLLDRLLVLTPLQYLVYIGWLCFEFFFVCEWHCASGGAKLIARRVLPRGNEGTDSRRNGSSLRWRRAHGEPSKHRHCRSYSIAPSIPADAEGGAINFQSRKYVYPIFPHRLTPWFDLYHYGLCCVTIL